MSDDGADGDKDKGKEAKSPSRPVTAAARRERRGSARLAGGKAEQSSKSGSDSKDSSSKDSSSKDKAAAASTAQKSGKGQPTPKRNRKEPQSSVFHRLARFIREVWAELRKVVWPTRKQMVTYTGVVLVFVAFMVALVFALDLGLHQLVEVVFGK